MRPGLSFVHDHRSIAPAHVREATRRGVPLEWFSGPGQWGLLAVRPTDVWAKYPLDKEWTVAYRLAAKDGLPMIAEARVFPSESGSPPGGWSADFLGVRASVPGAGLKARHLRARLGEHERAIRAELKRLRKHLPSIFVAELTSLGIEGHKKPKGPRTARRGRPQTSKAELARFAEEYVAACRRSQRPIQDVARLFKRTDATVRNFIFRARQRGILGPTPMGSPGGELTKLGQRLVRRLQRQNPVRSSRRRR